ncbi:MAG: hypothetical protein AB8H79_04915, partial [Myxococcota bacterium]
MIRDYTVAKGTPIDTVTKAINDSVATGASSATICVAPDPTTATTTCPFGTYTDTVTVPAGFAAQIWFEERTCLYGATAGVPAFTFNNSSPSSINDFHKLICLDTTALYVVNAIVDLKGRPDDGTQPMSEVTCGTGTALDVAVNGKVTSTFVDYGESVVGVRLRGGFASGAGGDLDASQGMVRQNETGILASEFASLAKHRNKVLSNNYIGYALDDSELTFTDALLGGNRIPTCYLGYAPYLPPYVATAGSTLPAGGFVAQDDSAVEFLNSRWVGNCTHLNSDLAVLRAHDDADLTVRNSTFDDNQATIVINASSTTGTLWDNIIADD